MANLTSSQIVAALTRLGELAAVESEHVELLLIGGAVMAIVFEARAATRDVDVVILSPREAAVVRRLAGTVAAEFEWPVDWLNDAAKGYLVGMSEGTVVLEVPGLRVRAPSTYQLLAMKLSAWRDDVDVTDARRLLAEVAANADQATIWQAVQQHLVPGDELKAQYAFADLWESEHDDDRTDR